jgi:hypothetical protein
MAALILLLITQFYRTAEAHEGPDSRFSDMATKDDAPMGALVARCHEDNELLIGYSPKESRCFPSLGFAPIPVCSAPLKPCFLPPTPTLFVAMVGRDTDETLLKVDGLVSAFSVGLVGDKVVLPPLAANADLKVEATTPKRGIPIAVGASGATAIRAHSQPIGAVHVALGRTANPRSRVIASSVMGGRGK